MNLPVRNPRTGEHDYAIEPLKAAEIELLAARLREAQKRWSAYGPDRRSKALTALADSIDRHREEIASGLAIDTGRGAISRFEVESVVRTARRWAASAPDLIRNQQPRRVPTSLPGIDTSSRLIPYPLVGIISPWNFPLTLSLIDAIPALAAGCAALVKPSEVTPRFIRPLQRAIDEVSEVAAVLALVEGNGATGEAIVQTVDYVAFTGSVTTGRRVSEAAARRLIPASLELGGKDPMIILASADPERAAAVALRASVLNTGQACQSIERVYVARPIAKPFVEALVAGALAARLNYPQAEQGEIGPFIFAKQAEVVAAQLDEARRLGATILTGGEIETLGGGLYLRPTVVTGVDPSMALMREETFGPVIPVSIFDEVDEAVELANGGEFGLSAAVIAGSVDEAEAVAVRLNAGGVSINDGALTALVWETEKSSFGTSGVGPSRMGASGLLRFFRRQALIRQTGTPLPLSAYAEDAA